MLLQSTPNTALAAGDIDLNYFQHQAFLDNAIRERGYAFTSVATGLLPNIGLYSLKTQRFPDLKEGARVGVANDPVNQGRGLLLLEPMLKDPINKIRYFSAKMIKL